MLKNKLLLLLFFTVSSLAFSDKITSFSLTSNAPYKNNDVHYFKDSLKLTASASIKGGWYHITVDGDRGGKFGVYLTWNTTSSSHSKTVYASKTYHAYVNQVALWDNNKHRSLVAVKDTDKPTISVSVSNTNPTNGNVTLVPTFSDITSAIDKSKAMYKINNGPWTSYYINNGSFFIPRTISLSANAKVSFKVEDRVGNASDIKEVSVTNIDKTKPTLTASSDNNSWTNSDVTVTADAEDHNSGIQKTEYSTNNSNWYSGSVYTMKSNGNIYFRTQDFAQNWDEGYSAGNPVKVSVSNIDKSPPTLSLTQSPTGWTNSDVTVQANASDGHSGISKTEYSVNGSSWTKTDTGTFKSDSNRTVFFKTTDRAGNSVENFIDITNIDKERPVLTLTPSETEWTREPVKITASGSDTISGIEKTEYSIDGVNWINGSEYTLISNNTVYFRTMDKAGNYNKAKNLTQDYVTVSNIDRTLPSISLSSPSSTWSKDSVSVTATVSDNGSGINRVEYSLDNNTWSTGKTAERTTNGTIYFKVTDNAGNEAFQSVEITTIDKTPPKVVITASKEWTAAGVLVSATGEDSESLVNSATMMYKVGENGDWNYGNSVEVKNNNTVYFKVFDNAGNESLTTPYIVNTIDRTAPSVTLTPSTDQWTNRDVSVSATATDSASGVKSIEYSFNRVNWKSGNTGIRSSNGSIYFRVTDNVGNIKESSYEVKNIDKTLPSVKILSSETTWTKNNVTLTAEKNHGGSGIKTTEYRVNGGTWQSGDRITLSSNGSVEFRVQNAIGIWSAEPHASYNVNFIDKTLPVVAGFTLDFNGSEYDTRGNSGLTISNIQVTEENLYSIEYIITNTSGVTVLSKELLQLPTTPVDVNLLTLSEGNYNISLKATDKAGNFASRSKSFIIDRTPPETTGLSLKISEGNTGKVIGDHDVTAQNPVVMEYSGLVESIDNPRYTYHVTKVLPTQFNASSAEFTDQIKTPLMTFSQGSGLYYIYSWLYDDAGNRSRNYVWRSIKFSNEAIEPPVLSGVKKAADFKDVITENDPVFIINPSLPMPGEASITGYSYKLYKGITPPLNPENRDSDNTLYTEGVINSSNPLNIKLRLNDTYQNNNFTGLDDNSEQEFYRLYVKALTDTGQESPFTNAYQFRVDTKAPENLVIRSSSHRETDSAELTAYSYDYIDFYWDTPTEMTGVETYTYYLSRDNINFTEGDINEVVTRGERNYLHLDLTDQEMEGSVFLKVKAVDYGGNEEEDSLEVRINRQAPQVTILSTNNEETLLTSTLYWSIEGDFAYQSIIITRDGKEYTTPLSKDIRSYDFTGLTLNERYKVKVLAYSHAMTPLTGIDSREFIFNKDNILETPKTEDYIAQFKGFEVFGLKDSLNMANSTGTLIIPDSLSFMNAGEKLTEIPLSDLSFSQTGFTQGQNSDIPFSVLLNNFLILPSVDSSVKSGLRAEKAKGLVLTNRILKYPKNNTEQLHIPLSELTIESASSMSVSGLSAPLTTPETIQTQYQGADSWKVEEFTSVELSDKFLVIHDGFVDFSLYDNLNITDFNNRESSVLPLARTVLDADRNIISSNIASEFIIGFGYGTAYMELKVSDARIIGNTVVIERGTLLFKEGYSLYDAEGNEKVVELKNIRISNTGEIINNPESEPFYIKHNDSTTFEISSFVFSTQGVDINGRVLVEGTPVKDSEFTDFDLTKEGITLDSTGILTNNFSFSSPAGYTVRALAHQVLITNRGYLLQSAQVDLSAFEADLAADLYSMEVDYGQTQIINPGVSDSSHPVSIKNLQYYKDENGSFEIHKLELSNTHLIARKTLITLPDFFSQEKVFIEDMIMDISGGTGVFLPGKLDKTVTTLPLYNGYTLTVNSAVYDSGFFKVPNGVVTLPSGSSPSVMAIPNLKLNHHTLTHDSLISSLEFTHDGWVFDMKNPVFSDTGIQGETTLNFTIGGISQTIQLDQFTLNSDGSYTIPKTELKTSSMEIYGYSASASGISLVNDTIHIDSLIFHSREKSIQLPFKGVSIRSDGSVLSMGESIKPKGFKSSNGFYAEPSEVEVRNQKLYFKGDVFLPEFLEREAPVNFKTFDVEITPDWLIKTPKVSSKLSASINGVETEIQDYFFYKEGLFIEKTLVKIDTENSFIIEDIAVSADSEILSEGHLSEDEENRKVTIFHWPVLVSQASYTPKGITLESHVQLPEDIGAPSLYFEDMVLFKSGDETKFHTNTVIESLEFGFENMNFEFEKIMLSSSAAAISNANITFPDNEMFGGRTISLKYFQITNQGSFRLEGSVSDPLDINGFDVFIKNLSFEDNKIDISGAVLIPYDFGIKELAGRTVSIKTLTYDFNTQETVFDIELDKVVVEIADGWTTEFTELSISSTGLTVGSGTVNFPRQWLNNISLKNVGFKNLTYYFPGGDYPYGGFDVEEIFLNDLTVNCEGYEFTINSAKYSAADGFILAGSFPLTGLFEGEATPPVIEVRELQIKDGFNIVSLDAGLQGQNLSLTPNGELLFNGYIGAAVSPDGFLINLEGTLRAGSSFAVKDLIYSVESPTELAIDSFQYDILKQEIKTLDATVSLAEQDFLNMTIKNFTFGLSYTSPSEPMVFTLGGQMPIPESFPGIGGEDFTVYGQFDSLGNFIEFNSGITINKDKTLMGDLTLKSGSNISIVPQIEDSGNNKTRLTGLEFSLNSASVEFNNNFSIESLRGGEINVHSLVINTTSGFDSCDLSFNTPDNMELFSDVYLQGGTISLKVLEGDITTTITGILHLPASMSGATISINTFKVSSNGDIEVDAGAVVSGNFYDQLYLNEGLINIKSGEARGSLDFDISGNFKITSTAIPKDIRNHNLYGSVSLTAGIEKGITVNSFAVGLESGSSIQYSLINGVVLSLDQLIIQEDGLRTAVTLTLENGFYGLEGTSKTEGSIFMNWQGEIIESDLIIRSLGLKYADMACEVNDLKINQDGINFAKATLTLPETLGGQQVGIANGGIDKNGKFYGDFVLEKINIDILGCQVVLYSPQIDFDNEKVSCAKSEFVLPSALGSAKIGLEDVSIGRNGLEISGGSFQLPDIDTGAMKFSNMGAKLSIAGGDYEIAAQGKVFIAGVGEIEAKISIVNIRQPDYPIGLKYAYFSFESSVGGIPLANTGLMLTGVRGGLAFGPPGDDLPDFLRDKFGGGMRIQLGMTITDLSMTVKGRTDFWLNVTNLDFALRGELEFLNGLFTSHAYALYTQSYGLELQAGVDISLLKKIYLEGRIRAHLFEYANKPRFCGEAYVNLSVQDLLWGFPETPMSLGRLGIEVGDFKEEKRGFKGYVTLDLIGTKGFYAGSDGSFELGDVNHYVLLDKTRSFTRSAGLVSYKENRQYSLYVQPIEPAYANTRSVKTTQESATERIIFAVEFTEGDPVVSAISPTGQVYTEGDDNVVVRRTSDKILMAVINPEAGYWSLDVENLAKNSNYTVEAIGFNKSPVIELTTPSFNNENAKTSYEVSGFYSSYGEKQPTVSLYVSREKGVHTGMEVATFTPEMPGEFNYIIDTSELNNGEYYLYAGIYDGANPELYSYAPGSIFVNNDMTEITPVNDLIAGVSDSKVVTVSFSNTYGDKAKGFNLHIYNHSTEENEVLDVGFLTKFTLSSLNKAEKYSLTIVPYDNLGVPGTASNTAVVDYSVTEKINNDFTVQNEEIYLEIDGTASSKITVTPTAFTETYGAEDYAELIITEIPEFMTHTISEERLSLEELNAFNIDIICASEIFIIEGERETRQKTKPGRYEIKALVRNFGNQKISKEIVIPVTVAYPQGKISNIYPESWHINDAVKVEIKGSGFTSESTVSIDGVSSEIVSQNSSTLVVNVPALTIENSGLLLVTNPGTAAAEHTVELEKPYYRIENVKNYSVINKGGTGWFYSRVKGFNRFAGSADFTLGNYPEGWNIYFTESAQNNSLFTMEVQVPVTAENGRYQIEVISQGQTINYTVNVGETYPNPVISALSTHSANWGEVIRIYGFGFNPDANVYFNSNPIGKTGQNQDYIEFIVPENTSSGIITVRRGDIISNGAEFEIKDNNFNIYPGKKSYILSRGESVTETVHIRGYADFVDLEVISENSDIVASLDASYVIPNGSVKLTVSVGDFIESGTYPVTIKGKGKLSEKEKTILVTVGENIAFTEKELLTGKVDNVYSDYLEITNNYGDYFFELAKDSSLPHGLSLDKKSGEIYGMPTKAGRYEVNIRVNEGVNRYAVKTFVLTISDSGWYTKEGAKGNNRFNDISSPGEDKITWESEVNNNSTRLLSSGEGIFTISEEEIISLDKNSGKTNFLLNGDFLDVTLSEGIILALENRYNSKYNQGTQVTDVVLDDTYLVIYSQETGKENAAFKGIKEYRVHKGILYLLKNDMSAEQVSLSSVNTQNSLSPALFTEDALITEDGIFTVSASEIKEFNGKEFILRHNVDEKPAYLTTLNNELTTLSNEGVYRELRREREVHTGVYQGKTALSPSFAVIYNDYGFTIINREDFSQKQVTMELGELMLTGDKLFIINTRGITSFNLYTGKTIWEKEGNFSSLISGGRNVYVLEDNTRVISFGGRENILSPETTFSIYPEQPNGDNNYYTVTPKITLVTEDKESYGEAQYTMDSENWTAYNGPVTLDQGYTEFKYMAYDSTGLSEELKRKEFLVDTVAPVTEMTQKSVAGSRGYTVSGISYTLTASDKTSQVRDTYYGINGTPGLYSEPVNINKEGEYTFTWYSVDNAGNREETKSYKVLLDLSDPTVRSEIYNDSESGTVYLFAEDSFSGINRIEYRINGSDIQNYVDPLYLPIGAIYNITYRSVDNAERKSQWENIVMDLSNTKPVDLIQNLRTTWGKGTRYVKKDLQTGDKLYADDKSQDRIDFLPDYLTGGEMIMGELRDKNSYEKNFYQFNAGLTIDLFMVKNKDSQTELDGTWTLLDQNVPINNSYFTEGADIYHKVIQKGEEAVVGGTAMWQKGGANLIIAQRHVSSDLKIFSPNPAKELYPLSRNWYASTRPEGEISRNWYYKTTQEEWNNLGKSFSGDLFLNYFHESTELTLRVDVTLRNSITGKIETISSTRDYIVANKAELNILEPVSGSQVLLKDETPLDFQTTDLRGNPSRAEVSWHIDNGDITDNVFMPKTPGYATIKGQFTSYDSWEKETSVTVDVVEDYTTETFLFNKEMTAPYGLGSKGRFYGFNTDHKYRLGETTYVNVPEGQDWSDEKITRMYIALEEGAVFDYLVNNGTYKVKILTGPLTNQDNPAVLLENEEILIESTNKSSIYTVETLVNVTDNTLSLSGSKDLQIISLEITRTEELITTTITPMTDYKIMTDQKWYEWNDSHYYPKEKNQNGKGKN